MDRNLDFRSLLRQEYEIRSRRNPAYSARAMARDLGLSSSFYSHLISGRKTLSEERARQIADRLPWNGEKKRQFIILVRLDSVRDEDTRQTLYKELQSHEPFAAEIHELHIDEFNLIKEWYHYAILELTALSFFKTDPIWISRTLGISLLEAEGAIARLKRLGLLETSGNKLSKTKVHYRIANVQSAAIKGFHMSMLEKAKSALNNQSLEEREFNSLTFAINPNLIPKVKPMIRDAMLNIMKELQAGERTEVYNFSSQFFRLTRRRSAAK